MKAGAALPSVLVALSLAGALALGASQVARQHAAVARVSGHAVELSPAVEEALVTAIVHWDSAAMADLPPGTTHAMVVPTGSGRSVDVWVTRTGLEAYWLVAEGRSGLRPEVRRRLGMVVAAAPAGVRSVGPRGRSDLP